MTSAEILAMLGYETAFFGVNAYLEQDHGLSQGFSTWDAHTGLSGRQLLNRVTAFLSARDPARPLYLVVHLFEPHCRYRAPDDLFGTFSPVSPGTRLLSQADYDRLGACYQLQRPDGSPELDLAVYDARYDEEVLEVDGLIGRLWRQVQPLDPWLAVVGDHGEAFWEHGDFGHGRQLYQEQVRVPLLVRPVGGVPGRVVETPTSTLLLAHRLLTTAGVELEPQETLIALTETDHEGHRLQAVVREEVKLVHDLVSGTVVTFDLSQDPNEQKPIPLPTEQASTVLGEIFAATQPGPAPVPWVNSDPEALKRLGYTE
jgi:arylsulfatase A-like enzyme